MLVCILDCRREEEEASQIEKKLFTFEMDTLRKILGEYKLDNIRNDEIRNRVGCTNILVLLAYARHHKWFGNLLHVDHECRAKLALQGKLDVIKRRGKPRTTRMSTLEERTRIKLSQATKLSEDRKKWIKLTRLLDPTSDRHYLKRNDVFR